MRKLLLAAGTVVIAQAAGAALANTTFQPGLWETKTRSPGRPDVETTRDCVTPEETKRETLEKRLAEAVQDPSCKYTQRSIGGGKFAISGACNNEGIRSSFRQTGTYSPTAMTMNMSMTLVAAPGAKPVAMNVISSSRRIAPTCPASGEN